MSLYLSLSSSFLLFLTYFAFNPYQNKMWRTKISVCWTHKCVTSFSVLKIMGCCCCRQIDQISIKVCDHANMIFLGIFIFSNFFVSLREQWWGWGGGGWEKPFDEMNKWYTNLKIYIYLTVIIIFALYLIIHPDMFSFFYISPFHFHR